MLQWGWWTLTSCCLEIHGMIQKWFCWVFQCSFNYQNLWVPQLCRRAGVTVFDRSLWSSTLSCFFRVLFLKKNLWISSEISYCARCWWICVSCVHCFVFSIFIHKFEMEKYEWEEKCPKQPVIPFFPCPFQNPKKHTLSIFPSWFCEWVLIKHGIN